MLESPVVKFSPKWLLRLIMRYLPKTAIQLMDVGIYANLWESVSGHSLSQRQMLEAGERIHVLERSMNCAEGITRRDDTLPQRFHTQGRGCDAHGHTVPIEPLVDAYYRLRGYDANGVPALTTRRRLAIPDPPAIVRHLHWPLIASIGRGPRRENLRGRIKGILKPLPIAFGDGRRSTADPCHLLI